MATMGQMTGWTKNQARPGRVQALGVCVLTLFLAAASTEAGEAPGWWETRGVIEAGAPTNDFAPVTVGQLKHTAYQAYHEMNAWMVGGAGPGVSNLVHGFANSNEFAVANLGQLKSVAKPFYDRLRNAVAVKTYPWTLATGDDADYALANIGQLKNVFSFDLTDFDSDRDGMPDWWEVQHGLNPTSGIYAGLSTWWTFDENTGTAVSNLYSDSYHGYTVSMSSTNWVEGVFGSALWFDGINDYVAIPQSPPLITQGPFTISAWVYAETPNDKFPTIISDSRLSSPTDIRGYRLLRWSNSTEMVRWETWSPTSSDVRVLAYVSAGMHLTNWHHVVARYNGSDGYVFIDGEYKGGDTGDFHADKRPDIWVGRGHISAGTAYWKGRIDDLRVYHSDLTSTQIVAMYDNLDDPDGDGYSNLEEYQADADPNWSNPVPAIAISYPMNGAQLP